MTEQRHIAILFHGRFPSEKAAALWVAKVAEGFGMNGFRTTLLIPHRRYAGAGADPFANYHLAHSFAVRTVWALDWFRIPVLRHLAFFASALSFALSVIYYLLRHAPRDTLVYSNDPQAMWLVSLFFRNSFYELHVVPTDKLVLYRRLFRRMRGFATITKWGKEELEKEFHVAPEKIVYAPGGVKIQKFDIRYTRYETRRKLGLPSDKKIVLYTGHLYQWKGVDTLAEAARRVPPDVLVYFVGGTEADVTAFRTRHADISNLRIVGHRPHDEIPLWQRAADVLVLPNTAAKRISKFNTSPMKLFEYMASEVPIIASDIPAIREVIGEHEAYFAEPDQSQKLAQAIERVLKNPAEAASRALRAREAVKRYSWEERGKKVSSFIATMSKP